MIGFRIEGKLSFGPQKRRYDNISVNILSVSLWPPVLPFLLICSDQQSTGSLAVQIVAIRNSLVLLLTVFY